MSADAPIPEEELLRRHASARTAEDRAALARAAAARPEEAALLADWNQQDAALAAAYGAVAAEPLPAAMRAALDAARQDEPAAGAAGSLLRAVAAAALLAIGAAGGFLYARTTAPASATPRFAENAITAYATYVGEVTHPVEVEATQAEHLTKWLSKRLGHPIKAPDFASAGFRMIGGRLLPSDSGPAALFMYEDDFGHRVTLYAAPGTGAGDTAFRFIEEGRVQSFYWIDGDLSYAVTGDLPRDQLRAIAVAAYDQLI